jgi:hypothetical protein
MGICYTKEKKYSSNSLSTNNTNIKENIIDQKVLPVNLKYIKKEVEEQNTDTYTIMYYNSNSNHENLPIKKFCLKNRENNHKIIFLVSHINDKCTYSSIRRFHFSFELSNVLKSNSTNDKLYSLEKIFNLESFIKKLKNEYISNNIPLPILKQENYEFFIGMKISKQIKDIFDNDECDFIWMVKKEFFQNRDIGK